MKGSNTWSYAPYRPLLANVGDIYICRIAPQKNAIHFEWLDTDDANYIICTLTTRLMPFRGAISALPRWYCIRTVIFLPRRISMRGIIRKI